MTREDPRYEPRTVETGPERVVAEVMRQYKVGREAILEGRRGRENEARKVAMYLVKRCYDWTLPGMAKNFGDRELFGRELELLGVSRQDDEGGEA